MKASDQSAWWVAAEGLLGAAVVCLPAALGGAPPWTLWILVGLAAAAAAAWSIGAWQKGRRWSWHPVLLLALVPLALEAAQLVPLPPFLLAKLAPASAELRDFALVPLGLERWRPVSVDAPCTWRLFARDLGLGGLLFVALQLGRLEGPRRRLLAVVGGAAVAFALIAFVHQLAGLDSLFGLYSFRTATPLLTPFGNANHLAAFLTLGGTVCLGLAVSSESRDAMVGWGIGAVGTGLATFLSMSRGGVGTMLITWGLVGTLLVARRAGGLRNVIPWVLMGATLLAAAGLAFEELWARAETLDSVTKLQATKLEAWPMFAQAARAASPAGLGRGAFEVGVSRWHEHQLSVTFTHPENLVLQWAVEVGPVAAAVVFALLGWVLWRTLRALPRRPLEQVALLAVVGVGLHDLFDFSLELNAVPAVVAVTLGLVAGAGGAVTRRVAQRSLVAAVGVASAVALFAAARGFPTHLEAEEELAGWIRAGRTPAELHQAVKPLVDRHPADFLLYANLAQVTALKGDPRDALAWVNRWLFLRPYDAHAHAAAALALLRLGRRDQALLEFRTSFQLGDFSAVQTALAVAAKQGDYEKLLIERRGLLPEALGVAVRLGPGVGPALLARAVAQPPSDEVRQEAQELLLGQEADPAKALALLEALPAASQERPELVALKGRLLVAVGRPGDGVKVLQALVAHQPGDVAAAFQLADVYAAAGQLASAREVLARLRPFVSSPAGRTAVFIKEAGLWEQEQRWARALDAWQTASRLEPQRADLHYAQARDFERMGSSHAALDELRKGRLLDTPEGARAQDAWLQRLQAAESGPLPPPSP